MLSPTTGVPLDNKLLSSLPRDQLDLLAPHMSTSVLAQGFVLLEAGDEFDHVYFPHNGMLSLLTVMRDGRAIEIATVGREGVVGAMAGLGLYKSSARVVVQLPLSVTRIAASQFRKVVDNSDSVINLCLRYNEVLLLQARVTAACNALHPVEARFCRWLLQSADRAESDTVQLTQEFLAEMLGVRRTSVTEVASHIQKLGAITYSRGVIQIIDRNALEPVLRMLSEAAGALEPVGTSDRPWVPEWERNIFFLEPRYMSTPRLKGNLLASITARSSAFTGD